VEDGTYQTIFSQRLEQFRKLADGRPVLLAMVDNQFTRTLGFYGGLSRFSSNSSDVFDGAHGLDNTYMVGILQGRRHSTYLRSVFDFTYQHGELPNPGTADSDIEVFSIMKNIYVDLMNPREYLTTPYLGFGVGWAYVDGEGSSGGVPVQISSESTFAYQLLAGLSLKLTPKSHLFTEYRYFSTHDDVFNSGIGSAGAFASNNLIFGWRLGH
jgi:opacity protein-like surface antigen